MTLYEIAAEYQELLEMAEGGEDLDPETLRDTLEAVGGELELKAESLAKVIRSIQGDINAVSGEISRLRSRKESMEANVRRIRDYIQSAMEATGKKGFRTPEFSFRIQANPVAVRVLDESKVPENFFVQKPPELDKTALKEYLARNGPQEYAELSQTESLRIR